MVSTRLFSRYMAPEINVGAPCDMYDRYGHLWRAWSRDYNMSQTGVGMMEELIDITDHINNHRRLRSPIFAFSSTSGGSPWQAKRQTERSGLRGSRIEPIRLCFSMQIASPDQANHQHHGQNQERMALMLLGPYGYCGHPTDRPYQMNGGTFGSRSL
jgi:hypothetical protein